jgi:hypothetical protein
LNSRFVVFFLLLSVCLGACLKLPEEPVHPEWDVEVSASLSQTSHTIRELVGEIASLPPQVQDTLYLPGIAISYAETLSVGDTTGDGKNDSGVSGDFFQSVIQARLFVETTNGTPVHLNVSMDLLDGLDQPLLSLPASGQSVLIPAAPLDGAGKVGPPTVEVSTFDLTPNEVEMLGQADRLRYVLNLTFPEGVSVPNVLAADSMQIRAWGTFLTRIDP